MGDDGIHLTAYGTSDSFFVSLMLRRVWSTLSRGHGLFVQYATMMSVADCYFKQNDGCGVRVDFSQAAFSSCAFEDNCKDATLSPTTDGQALMRTCYASRFDACHWESFTGTTQISKRGLVLINSPGCSVTNCRFTNAALSSDTVARGIYCTYGAGSGVLASVFYGNSFTNVKTALEIDGQTNPALDCVVFPQFANLDSGATILPFGVEDNGLVMIGGRPAPVTPADPAIPLKAPTGS